MPLLNGFPRTTHQWLKPLYDALDAALGYIVPSGASGIPNASWVGRNTQISQVGNSTGLVGFYGATGILKPTGLGNTGGTTGATALTRSNGGTGTTFYTLDDLVAIGKMRGDLF